MLDLYKQGSALRLRWEWLKHTDDTKPWQGIPLMMDTQVQKAFTSLVQWNLGNEERVVFWKDHWINGATVAEIAAIVHAQVRTQVVNQRSVREALHQHRWANDIVGNLSADGLVQILRLREIMISIELDPTQFDTPLWQWNNIGTYTLMSTYAMLWEGSIHFPLASAIWKLWTLLSCKLFMWLAT